ncbi:MAG TPA: cysteine--tRNA ligase [Verrucomicrobiae bacterium]|nr:cysteine--tRNA ligase [Verrucomicrobiae bacterium]
MALKLFNTLSRSIQEFAPLDPVGKKAGLYCCGPTVYDFAHIGNWRTFVFADLVRRHLEFKGYAVTHVMNITDVEDKIIKGIRESKTTLREFTGKYETAFLEDLATLNCRKPTEMPHATEYIPEIIALIEKLVARSIAYKAADGSVYFSIEKYRGCGCTYGRLLKLNFDELRVGDRVATDEYDKESLADFALWKARVPADGEVFWPSPWGEGRPGWHIECSAMSMKMLGESFDLHLGGEDLKFPHHEDEIAQSEGATGKPFVKYWLHGAFLLVEGKKMSKSLGNFFTLRDLLAKGFSGREIRYLLLTAHYRETFNFTLEGLQGARTALARIDECIGKLREIANQPLSRPSASVSLRRDVSDTLSPPGGERDGARGASKLISDFPTALDDDLNISAAWGEVFKWVTETNKRLAANSLSAKDATAELTAWDKVDCVLGIGTPAEAEAPPEIIALLEARQAARKAKDFKKSDAIRDELKAKSWAIEDTSKGPKLKRI